MKRHRYITIAVIGAVLAISGGAAEAKSFSLHVGLSIGHRIAHPIVARPCVRPVVVRPVVVRPPVRTVVITSPFRHRIAPIRHHHRTIVVSRPWVKSVFVRPVRTVVVTTKTVVVKPAVVTVWIRNSNGSQSPVKLTHSGPGYVGPRGEYYPTMPDNEQLRTVYGF